MIRIDALWLATTPIDMRMGTERPDFDSFHPFFTPWPKSGRYESMS